MATTTNYALTLLEIGQKEKETVINTNFTQLDNVVPKYLGDLTVAPTVLTNIPVGSTYYDTGTSKLRVLRNKTGPVWSNVA